MKTLLIATLITLSAGTAYAADCKVPPSKHSAEFEKLKALEGRWEGSMVHEGKPDDLTVTYHLTSGGTAVVETISPGTPHEMVSVYHDENGKLVMTHYCMIGNQPKLAMVGSKANEIDLDFAKDNVLRPESEDHMHSLDIVFIDGDTLVERWGSMHEGKKVDEKVVMKLSRVK